MSTSELCLGKACGDETEYVGDVNTRAESRRRV